MTVTRAVCRATDYVHRPEVRDAPFATTARRIYVEFLRRFAPMRLRRAHTGRLRGTPYRFSCALTESVGCSVFLYGVYEPLASQAFAALIEPGDLVADVGAHCGDFALLAAHRVGPMGRVMAFEPQDSVRMVLARNIEINGLSQVEVLPVALGSENEQARLYGITNSETGSASLAPGGDGGPHDGTVVEVRRLDDIVGEESAQHLSAMKIDVEGFEPGVLRGASNLLFGAKPGIVFEVNNPSVADGHYTCETFDVLRGHGYDLFGMLPARHRGFRLELLGRGEDPTRFQEPSLALNLLAVIPGSEAERRLRAGGHLELVG